MISSDDYAAIAQVAYRYSYAMDAKRWEEMDEVFLPDAEIILGDQAFRNRASGVAAIRAFIECCSITHHMNSNLLILSAEPDRVRSLLNFRAWHRGTGDRSAEVVECMGSYTDEFSRTPAGWRIARREEQSPIVIGDFAALFAAAMPEVERLRRASA